MHSTGSKKGECGLQKVILDLLSHVCAARPRGGGILNGSGPLGECTDTNSDVDAVLMVTCFSEIIKKSKENR